MPIEITMPKLSDTMEQGTILRWFKREGESVQVGEPLAEVETDKADMELEASDSGTLRQIRVKEGESATVGAVIGILEEAGAEVAAHPSQQAGDEPAPTAPAPRPVAPTVPPAPPSAAKAAAPRPPTRPKTEAPTATPGVGAQPRPLPVGRQSLSKMRLAIAKQMTAAQRDVPHFYVISEIDMSEAARMREALSEQAVVERVTFTHLLLRALALTLSRHPRVNASWVDGGITFHPDINIGIAVAVEDGLIAPVLRRCQDLSLRQIARAATELIANAQDGRFSGDVLTGATFTLSNMGMLDIEEFSAVITPPQAAILAVGSIKDRPVVRDGHLAVARTMRVTLSVDHRVLNGVEAGRFLEDLKRTLERPALLLLGPD